MKKTVTFLVAFCLCMALLPGMVLGAAAEEAGGYSEFDFTSPGPSEPSSDDDGDAEAAPAVPYTEESDGWDEIQAELSDKTGAIKSGSLAPGTAVTVWMNGATSVPAKILAEIAGQDLTLKFKMGGITWEVSGKDVPSGPDALDLEFTTGGNSIPVHLINGVSSVGRVIRLNLSHDGPFGMDLLLSVSLQGEYDGYWANLYYYDGTDLVFCHAARIEGGKVSFPFDHASSYVVVLDVSDHSLSAGMDLPQTGEDNGGRPAGLVLLGLAAAACAAVAVFRCRRSGSEKEA